MVSYNLEECMYKILMISVATLGLTACGGGNDVAKQLEASCESMATMSGKTPAKGACKCMSSTLVENLSAEDAEKVATAFGNMETPEDTMANMMPLLANVEIMKGLKAVKEKCEME